MLGARVVVVGGKDGLRGWDRERRSRLWHTALAPAEWRVRAHEHLRVDMNMMPAEAISSRSALKGLPPLIKGYLRAGAYIGDGAVIDRQFGTIDVLIVLPVEAIRSPYAEYFGTAKLAAPLASDLLPLN